MANKRLGILIAAVAAGVMATCAAVNAEEGGSAPAADASASASPAADASASASPSPSASANACSGKNGCGAASPGASPSADAPK
jgi:hypothetical protein